MPTDPKWRTIARKSGQRVGDVIAVFNFVLVNASGNATERGTLSGLDLEDVATALDLSEADVEAILSAMQSKVLDGDRLTGWEKRQPKREDTGAADRKRAWKERHKNATERNGTHGNAPETETETDTETDTDIKKTNPSDCQKKAGPGNKTKLPDGCPTPEARSKAVAYWQAKGRVDLDVDDEAMKFRLHHTKHGNRMANWEAAWQTWYVNALEFKKPPPRGSPEDISTMLRKSYENEAV